MTLRSQNLKIINTQPILLNYLGTKCHYVIHLGLGKKG
jgi:hypothetical protein